VRCTLSYRDVEDLLVEPGLDFSYEQVRWVLKFGPLFTRELRRRPPQPSSQASRRDGRAGSSGCGARLTAKGLDLLVQRRRHKAQLQNSRASCSTLRSYGAAESTRLPGCAPFAPGRRKAQIDVGSVHGAGLESCALFCPSVTLESFAFGFTYILHS